MRIQTSKFSAPPYLRKWLQQTSTKLSKIGKSMVYKLPTIFRLVILPTLRYVLCFHWKLISISLQSVFSIQYFLHTCYKWESKINGDEDVFNNTIYKGPLITRIDPTLDCTSDTIATNLLKWDIWQLNNETMSSQPWFVVQQTFPLLHQP